MSTCRGCAERDRRIAELEARDARREAEVRALKDKVEELQRAQKRQAAPFSRGEPKASPKKPGRKPGEAYGVKAWRKPPDEVDEVHRAPLPRACPDCGGEIESLGLRRQFQVEIPREPIRRRFDVETGRCVRCHRAVHGRHPLQTSDALGAAGSQIGPDAQAIAVHLNKEGGLSHGKVARFMDAAFGIDLSRGGSAQLMMRCARRSQRAFGEIRLAVKRSRRCSGDETGWRVGGRPWWLWGFVAPRATLYLIRESRGHDVVQEALGEDYSGTVEHDGWGPYDCLQAASHQQCLRHFLRRCVEMEEVARAGAVRFPRAVKALLKHALALRDRREAREISPHGLAVAVGRLEARLGQMLAWTRVNAENERLAKHLDRHHDQLFTFLRRPGIEATNWRGEHAMRGAVVNRKVWGGSRTPAGAHAQEVLMSVLRTCLQNGRDAVAFLSLTLRAPHGHAPPLLAAAT